MLCFIEMAASSIIDRSRAQHVLDVPDDLFMSHMAMYDKFMPSALSDAEIRRCVFLGTRHTMEYIGPAEEKETK